MSSSISACKALLLLIVYGCLSLGVGISNVNAEASFLSCGQIANWVAGRANGFGDNRHAATYSAGSAANCGLSITPSSTTYTAGQTFTVRVASNTNIGFKIETTAGTLSGPSSGGSTQTAKCVNFNLARQSSGTMTFTAPASGNVQIKALCAQRSGAVLVSSAINLTPPVATASPTTGAPTRPGETRSPTVEATPSPTIPADLPAGASTDPNFNFELSLGPTMNLFYTLNDTHVKIKMEQLTPGYLSMGPGLVMVGSTVVVGMDPTVNAPSPAVGLYKLNSEFGSTNADIMSNVAVTDAQLLEFGISDTSFSTVNGVSTLQFSMEVAKQKADFTLVKADGSNVDIVYAGGPTGADGAFCKQGTCFIHDSGSFGALPQQNFAFGPGEALPGDQSAIPLSTELMVHIITMLVGWGILIPLGIVIPLFNNIKYSPTGTAFCGISGPNWVKYHWVLQVLGLILTYVGTATGIMEVGGNHFEGTHQAIGLFLLIASILQPMFAFLRPERKTVTQMGAFMRKIFDYTHLPFGYFIAFLAIIENLTGVELFSSGLSGLNYDFGGSVGAPGFGGPLGAFTLIISVVFFTLLVLGLARAARTKCMSSGDETGAYQNMGNDPTELRKPKQTITLDELAMHNNEKSFWVVYKNKVYDVTAFVNSHPGGKKVMMPYAGKDMTKAYDDTGHSPDANAMLPKYLIGVLSKGRLSRRSISQRISAKYNEMKQYMAMPDGFSSTRLSMAISRFSSIPENWTGQRSTTSSSNRSGALVAAENWDPNKFLSGGNQQRKRVVLTERYQISHNVYYLKFSFPTSTMVLGLPTGKHIAIYAPNIPGKSRGKWNGQPDSEADKKEIQRKFTPVSCDEMDVGYFALVVKVYRPSPQFPDGGKMSRYLETLRVGSSLEIAGPFGSHQYIGRGRFNDGGNELLFNECAMIAGGSGITPVLQIASTMLRDPQDRTRIALLYANSTSEDVLMKDHLDELQRRYPHRFHVWYTVSQDPKQSGKHYSYSDAWKYSIGRITKQMLREHLPAASRNSVAIHCGPKPMMESVTKLLQELGYPEERIIEY